MIAASLNSRFVHRHARNRGTTAVLAMLFLVVFSTLALGFYASTTTSSQMSSNDQHISEALMSAESGTAFLRYQLSTIVIPARTKQNQMLAAVASGLSGQLNGTGNMHGMTVGYTSGGSSIAIPGGATQRISLGRAGTFRVDITQSGSLLNATCRGYDSVGRIQRLIRLQYQIQETTGTIFNYGMATNGAVTLSGGILKGIPDSTRGRFLSTSTATNTPLTMSGSANITGDVSFVNPIASVAGSGTIGGTNNSMLWPINKGIAAPEFPYIDTTPYTNYLATITPTVITGSTSVTPLSNIRIKANSNPTFSGGGVINGLIYIETPNKVTFSGGTKITGVIAVDNVDDTGTDTITISGGGVIKGPDQLGPEYGTLRNMTGAAVLAPNFTLTLTGGSSTIGGSVFVKAVSMSGGSGGAVSGSVVSYGTASTTFSGGSGFTFTNTGPTAVPTSGVHFAGSFVPISSSYLEVLP